MSAVPVLYRSILRACRRFDQKPWTRCFLVQEPAVRPFLEGIGFFLKDSSCTNLARAHFRRQFAASDPADRKRAIDAAFACLRALNKRLSDAQSLETTSSPVVTSEDTAVANEEEEEIYQVFDGEDVDEDAIVEDDDDYAGEQHDVELQAGVEDGDTHQLNSLMVHGKRLPSAEAEIDAESSTDAAADRQEISGELRQAIQDDDVATALECLQAVHRDDLTHQLSFDLIRLCMRHPEDTASAALLRDVAALGALMSRVSVTFLALRASSWGRAFEPDANAMLDQSSVFRSDSTSLPSISIPVSSSTITSRKLASTAASTPLVPSLAGSLYPVRPPTRLELQRDLDFVNFAIRASCNADNSDVAFQLFALLASKGVQPSSMTFFFMADACSSAAPSNPQVEQARATSLLTLMRSYDITPTVGVYNCIMDCFSTGSAADLDRALRFLTEMGRDRVIPDRMTFLILFRGAVLTEQPAKVAEVLKASESYGMAREDFFSNIPIVHRIDLTPKDEPEA